MLRPSAAPLLRQRGSPPLADVRHAAARALAEALRERARHEPLVLLVDDGHLADPTSLDALEVATLAGTRAPLWVCIAARPALLGAAGTLLVAAGLRAAALVP